MPDCTWATIADPPVTPAHVHPRTRHRTAPCTCPGPRRWRGGQRAPGHLARAHGGPARPRLARHPHPGGRGVDVRVRVHPCDRHGAAAPRLCARGARAAPWGPHPGGGAGAGAAARVRSFLPGRQRRPPGRALAPRHRPELWLPGQNRQPASRRRRALAGARVGGPDRGRGAAGGAGAHPGLGQDAPGGARRPARPGLRAGHRGRRGQRAGGARAHQAARLPATGVLGPHRPSARACAPAHHCQRRDLVCRGRAALPPRVRLRHRDDRPWPGQRPGLGPGAARARRWGPCSDRARRCPGRRCAP